MNKSNLSDTTKIALFNILLFLILLFWNLHQPFMGDDDGVAAGDVLATHTLMLALEHQYFFWTGRVVAEVLKFGLESQSYLWILSPTVKIINSFVVVFAMNLIYQILFAKDYRFWRYFIVVTIFIISYICIGNFALDFIWYTVAMQYAWGFALILYLVISFYNEWQSNKKVSSLRLLFYSISALFLGLYNEIYVAFVVALLAALVITGMVFKFSLKPLYNKQYLVFLTILAISSPFMIFAPGNFVRQEGYLSDPANAIPYTNIFLKFAMTYVRFFRYGYHVVAAVLIFMIGIWVWKRRKQLPASLSRFMFFMLVLLNIHIISFVGVAYYSPISSRMNIFIDLIIFLVFAKFVSYYFSTNNLRFVSKFKVLYVLLNLVVVIWVSYSYILLYSFYQERYRLIFLAKSQGIENVQVPSYCVSSVFKWPVYVTDITWDARNFVNYGMAAFYGVKSIEALPCRDG